METTGADGSSWGPMQKPMDKKKGDYTANESVPNAGSMGLEGTSDVPSQENEGDLSKKFG